MNPDTNAHSSAIEEAVDSLQYDYITVDPRKLDYDRPTQEMWARLNTFAASFNHTIDVTPHPILIWKQGERWVGYCQIVNLPVVFTAWHPQSAKPRDTLEVYKLIRGWAKIQHGGGFTTVPLDTETFTPKVMKKLGFNKTGMELYEL